MAVRGLGRGKMGSNYLISTSFLWGDGIVVELNKGGVCTTLSMFYEEQRMKNHGIFHFNMVKLML